MKVQKNRQWMIYVMIIAVVTATTHFCISQVSGTQTQSVKNLLTEGDIKGTMKQARSLLEELRKNNWDYTKVDQALRRVPDQDFAESPMARKKECGTFSACPQSDVYKEVAFYSNLYVRQNLHVVKGAEGVTRPEGFFIVGWKDGRVTQVPIEEVRLYPNPKEADAWFFVFPGMEVYQSKLASYPGVQKPPVSQSSK